MDENMIHRYLAESPFFDFSTKNGLLMEQGRFNNDTFLLTQNRANFEDTVSRQRGPEYMIVGEPQQVANEPSGVKSQIWVIRKQDRNRIRNADGSVDQTLETLGTLYVVGDNMYQAPSVGDIVGNRLLSAVTSLSKFLDQANDLPTFSPTTGYSYIPHASNPTTAGSTQASPGRSREGSLIPGAESQLLRSGSVVPDNSQAGGIAHKSSSQDTALLLRSLNIFEQFGDEYMDENPVLGEPGQFKFTSSTTAVKKRKADDEAATAAAKAKQEAASRATSPKIEKLVVPSPPAVMTEAKAAGKDGRRGSKTVGDKKARKKSRVNAGSPTTPGSATTAPSSAI